MGAWGLQVAIGDLLLMKVNSCTKKWILSEMPWIEVLEQGIGGSYLMAVATRFGAF